MVFDNLYLNCRKIKLNFLLDIFVLISHTIVI